MHAIKLPPHRSKPVDAFLSIIQPASSVHALLRFDDADDFMSLMLPDVFNQRQSPEPGWN